jgi:hypothetical protein
MEDKDAKPAELALGFFTVLSVPISLAAMLPNHWALPFLGVSILVSGVLAARAAANGTKATGHTTTRWLLRALLLLDAGILAGCELNQSGPPWALLVVALIVPNLLGAKLLFGGGPKPAKPALPPPAQEVTPTA